MGGLGEPIFSSPEVCEFTGVTARQLQWWEEHGVIRAGRHGHRRVFRPADVMVLLTVAELRRKGLSLQKIRGLVRRLRQEIEQHADDLRESGATWYVLTNGEALYMEGSPEGVVERLKKQRRPMWLVCLSDWAGRLRALEKKRESGREGRRRRQPPGEQPSLFD